MTAPGRDSRPWTPVELGLLLSLVYLLLLISLAGTRLAGREAGSRPAAADRTGAEVRARLVADTRPAAPAPVTPAPAPAGAAAPDPAGAAAPDPSGAAAPPPASARGFTASCVGARTVPRSYAGGPGVEAPMAFGPPVEPGAARPVESVNGALIQRLCGGVPEAGQPARAPDRRLFVALDAVVNGRDPNRAVTRAGWAAGVDAFITRDARWTRARIVTRDWPTGTRTYGMRVRAGQDPLVETTRLMNPTRSRYLVLPVRRAGGGETVLTLRLACGFQPTFPPG